MPGKPRKAATSSITVKTVKRLFALSSNRCAYPGCTTKVIDYDTGTILAEICHICGDKPLSARYDRQQSESERNAFGNLLLLCGSHHKIVDDNSNGYPPSRLHEIKAEHERKSHYSQPLPNEYAKQLLANTVIQSSSHGKVTTNNQHGGQTANIINNIGLAALVEKAPVVTAKLSIEPSIETIDRFGCPGAKLTLLCQSSRQAKIAFVKLSVVGKGYLALFEKSFQSSFGVNLPTFCGH